MPALIARVVIDSPLPHLDGEWDYQVPEDLAPLALVGAFCRVRFSGSLTDAVIVGLTDRTEFAGSLTPIKSIRPIAALTAEAIAEARVIAEQYCGSLWDVLRLVVPGRVASVDKREWPAVSDASERTATPRAPSRQVWLAAPQQGEGFAGVAESYADWITEQLEQGSVGAVIVAVPDTRHVKALVRVLESRGQTGWSSRKPGDFVAFDAADSPAVRYGKYLAARFGQVRVVIGTRTVVTQPVPKLVGLAMWDDAHPLYEEPHSPYFHSRTVLALRADRHQASVLIGGFSVSVDAMTLARNGWAVLQESAPIDRPRLMILDESAREYQGSAGWHWLPPQALREIRSSLASGGPALVLVPSTGYVNVLACQNCREPAVCRNCQHDLRLAQGDEWPTCSACGLINTQWHCPHCNSGRTRNQSIGIDRVAEELQRTLPDAVIHVSSAALGAADDFSIDNGVVVATPGAVPTVRGGYSFGVAIRSYVPQANRIGGEALTLRWWLNIGALIAPGATLALAGRLAQITVNAVASWRPRAVIDAVLTEAKELRQPPFTRAIAISGNPQGLEFMRNVQARYRQEVDWGEHTVFFVDRQAAIDLLADLRALVRALSKQGEQPLYVKVDPVLDN